MDRRPLCKLFRRAAAGKIAEQGSLTGVRTYLDHNATTPLCPEARVAMLSALELCGSASSIHGEGRAARQRVEGARAEIAALVGADPKNVIFVSGASEANATALSLAWQNGSGRAPLGYGLVSAIEHASGGAGGDRKSVV